jgi:hypothetical protein
VGAEVRRAPFRYWLPKRTNDFLQSAGKIEKETKKIGLAT